ncbi:MAG: hypothetical protein ACTSX6_02120 [Candidatus Heimdallarchaeaceae archaeon]
MRLKKGVLLFFTLTIMIVFAYPVYISIGQEDIHESPLTTFYVDDVTNFTFYSSAPLKWKQYSPVNLTIYINSTGLPTDVNLTIISISIFYNITDNTHGQLETILTPNTNMTKVNQLLELRKTLLAPNDADSFTITFIILAKSTLVPENQVFRAYFPGDENTIEVKKEAVLPIINLPGFPDSQTFLRWIFIFFIVLVLIAFPGIFVASFKIKEKLDLKKKKGEKKK